MLPLYFYKLLKLIGIKWMWLKSNMDTAIWFNWFIQTIKWAHLHCRSLIFKQRIIWIEVKSIGLLSRGFISKSCSNVQYAKTPIPAGSPAPVCLSSANLSRWDVFHLRKTDPKQSTCMRKTSCTFCINWKLMENLYDSNCLQLRNNKCRYRFSRK